MCKNAKNKIPDRFASSYQIERWARHERDLVMSACIRAAASGFAEWLGAFVRGSARVARHMAATRRERDAVRALQQLDDRTLADIGVPRSEIEAAVHDGQPARVTFIAREPEPESSTFPEMRKAA